MYVKCVYVCAGAYVFLSSVLFDSLILTVVGEVEHVTVASGGLLMTVLLILLLLLLLLLVVVVVVLCGVVVAVACHIT